MFNFTQCSRYVCIISSSLISAYPWCEDNTFIYWPRFKENKFLLRFISFLFCFFLCNSTANGIKSTRRVWQTSVIVHRITVSLHFWNSPEVVWNKGWKKSSMSHISIQFYLADLSQLLQCEFACVCVRVFYPECFNPCYKELFISWTNFMKNSKLFQSCLMQVVLFYFDIL